MSNNQYIAIRNLKSTIATLKELEVEDGFLSEANAAKLFAAEGELEKYASLV